MQTQFTRLKTTFAGLPRNAQIAVAAVAAVTLIVLVMVFHSATSTSWVMVPTDSLQGKQANDATTALTAAKISNKLTPNQMVEVPQADLAKATATLAAANIGGAGTHTTCSDAAASSSSFMQAGSEQTKNARTSCMQNEIENVVENYPGVASAQVNLKTPADKLFTDEQAAAGASIFVKMENENSRLDSSQVKSIRQYVSNAVENVKPSAVLVTDSQGVLNAGKTGAAAGGAMTEASLKLTMERTQNMQVENDLTRDFEKLAGPGKVNVISNVDLNMDKVRREVKDFGGPDNQQGVKAAEKSKLELVGGTATANGGPSGDASNISQDATGNPTGTLTDTSSNSIAAAGAAGASTKSYTNSTVDTTYNNDEVAEAIGVAQGAVNENHLSIVVDQGTPLATQNAIKSSAQAYMGGHPHDSFSFAVAPFHHSTNSGGAAHARAAMIQTYLKWLVAGLGLLGMAFLLRRQLNQRTEELLYPIDEPFLLEQGGFEPIPLAELEAAVAAATSMDNQKRLDLQRKVEQIALEKPGDVATALRGWLHDDADDRGYDFSGSGSSSRR